MSDVEEPIRIMPTDPMRLVVFLEDGWRYAFPMENESELNAAIEQAKARSVKEGFPIRSVEVEQLTQPCYTPRWELTLKTRIILGMEHPSED